MTTLLITWSILGMIYVAIGTWACAWGPLRGGLHRFRWEMDFGLTLQDWAKSWKDSDPTKPPPEPVSRWRWWSVMITVHAGTLLGWPVFLPEAWRLQREMLRKQREYWATRPYQRLGKHGFAGNIRFFCLACRHTQVVLSRVCPADLRDEPGCFGPAQCLACHRFAWARLDIFKVVPSQHCDCGGELSNDHLTLCPKCGSEDIKLMHWSAWGSSPLRLEHEARLADQNQE